MEPMPRPESAPRPAEDLLADLFSAHHAAVFGAAYRLTGQAPDADDVVQTVFLRLAQSKERVNSLDRQGTAAYLRRSAVNAALDILRARRRRSATAYDEVPEGELADRQAGPERRQESTALARELQFALTELEPNNAEVFVLRYIEGFGNKEIATALGRSQTAVAVSLHRTRARLQKKLASHRGGSR